MPILFLQKYELLQEYLQLYSMALPPMPPLMLIGMQNYDDQIFYLEGNWTDVVQEQVSST